MCSDGKTYDLARHYSGGWGPGSWRLLVFCNSGTLKQGEYDGRSFLLEKYHPEVEACAAADTPAIRLCISEFKSLNKSTGEGDLPLIVHGKRLIQSGDRSPPRSSSGAALPGSH